jgi:hypothetical protein
MTPGMPARVLRASHIQGCKTDEFSRDSADHADCTTRMGNRSNILKNWGIMPS